MPERDSDILWFVMLLRRICILFLTEAEERYGLERSIVPKDQRRRDIASR